MTELSDCRQPGAKKTVLFLVGGFGLGNSTRCGAVISKLIQNQFEVDVATSSNGIWYFSGLSGIRSVFTLKAIGYARTQAGELSLLGTVLKLPSLLIALIGNAFRVWRLIRKDSYSVIVADSEYSAFLVSPFIKVPVLALNNVFGMPLSPSSAPLTWPLRAHKIFEYCDYYLQKILSDFQVAPTLDPSQVGLRGRTLFCAPLVRDTVPERRPANSFENALVIVSGSRLGFSGEAVAELAGIPWIRKVTVLGMEGTSHGSVFYAGRRQDIGRFLSEADFIVGSGGHSTLSEGLMSRRPILTIPLANHYEQYSNAQLVERMGAGVSSTVQTLSRDLERLRHTSRFPDFTATGAESVSQFIARIQAC